MYSIKSCSKVAALACVLSVVACGGDDQDRPVLLATSALENPIAACQAELSTCQRGPGGSGCQEQMRSCLENYAAWLAAVREGITQCRTQAGLCVSNGGSGGTCSQGYDACIEALYRSDPSDDDAGVADEDAGAAGAPGAAGRGGRGPRGGSGGAGARGGRFGGASPFPGLPGAGQGFPGLPGAGGPGVPGLPGANGGLPGLPGRGAAGDTAAAGSGGTAAPGVPGLPGRGRPGTAPETACMEKLAQCMQSGRDLAECADEARECLRTDPVSALFRN